MQRQPLQKRRLLFVAALFFVTGIAPVTAEPSRPNILFILTEDQGAHLRCLGTAGLQTPNMDKLVKSGVLFRNGFINYPVCSSSKATLYTGRYNHANGIMNNTVNYPKPADRLTPQESKNPLYVRNRIRAGIPTLTMILRDHGYYQAAGHKLHVAPVEFFPYDEFIKGDGSKDFAGFIQRAARAGKPWFFLNNIPNTHRPYPNSDKDPIRVNPAEVKLPAFLPDTPTVRQDWAEYLASIEEADALVGQTLAALKASGEEERTIVIFMGDHGPTFVHGKMTPYDLGLRVPFVIRAPGCRAGFRTDALATGVDVLPTLLDLVGIAKPPGLQGVSLAPVLNDPSAVSPRQYAFAEISHKGNIPNEGLQERAVCDGRWKLIYREKTSPPWRQVNEDSKRLEKWGNRTYDETIRVKDRFPDAYRILTQLDPQHLNGQLPVVELYDLQNDPDEMRDLARGSAHRSEIVRLYAALRQWAKDTSDSSLQPPDMPPTINHNPK